MRLLICFILFTEILFANEVENSFYLKEHTDFLKEVSTLKTQSLKEEYLTNYLVHIKGIYSEHRYSSPQPEGYTSLFRYWIALKIAFRDFETSDDCSISRHRLVSSYSAFRNSDESEITEEGRQVLKILEQICPED